MSEKNRKEKQIVVITGAANGIGQALAEIYLAEKATVIALDIDDAALKNFPGEKRKVDVTNSKALHDCAAEIKQTFGAPTLWINNAGITKLGPFTETPAEDFERVMAINFNGVVFGTRAALSVMKDPARGTIVNMASVAGLVPAPFMTSYVASKHAVVGFTRTLQQEFILRQSPIKVLFVAPGFVRTNIMAPQNGIEFPDSLNFMVADVKTTAQAIAKGIARGTAEIYPTLSGRMFKNMHSLFPGVLAKSSRLLVAKNWKEVFGITKIKP